MDRNRPLTAKEAFYVCLSMAGVAVAIGVILLLLFGCASRPCTMREWATSYNCK